MSVPHVQSFVYATVTWFLAQKFIVISLHTKKAIAFALQSTNLIGEYYENLSSQQSNNLACGITQSEHDFHHASYRTNPSPRVFSFLVISQDVLFIFIIHQASTTQSQSKKMHLWTHNLISLARFFRTWKASMHLGLYSFWVSQVSLARNDSFHSVSYMINLYIINP